MQDKVIIIIGNPLAGFDFIGPFDDADIAADYGSEASDKGLLGELGDDYWIAPLKTPETIS